jgi:hypothetical protein
MGHGEGMGMTQEMTQANNKELKKKKLVKEKKEI